MKIKGAPSKPTTEQLLSLSIGDFVEQEIGDETLVILKVAEGWIYRFPNSSTFVPFKTHKDEAKVVVDDAPSKAGEGSVMVFGRSSDDVIPFGKHQGKTAGWIFDNDPAYIRWVHINVSRINVHPELLEKVDAALDGRIYRHPIAYRAKNDDDNFARQMTGLSDDDIPF